QLDQQRASAIQRDGLSAFVDSWYQMDLFRSMAQHSEAFAAMKTARSRNSAEWMAKVIHEMSPGVQPSLWDGLPNLITDVLLIAGAQDSKYTSTLKIAAGKMPRASLAVIPNAGHNTHFEAPDPFANTVKNFLEAATLKRK
ncbi:MAG: alpha/beta fold hydrolase, partial [Chloroflexota bacterium]